jgi:hypothetical protein
MTIYKTMTVAGGFGSDIDADDDGTAEAKAVKAGYEVLDIVDSEDGPVIVIGG